MRCLLATGGPSNYEECSVAAWLTTIHATIMNQDYSGARRFHFIVGLIVHLLI